jgi:diguanylate cyclase (GGDEF)-like protein
MIAPDAFKLYLYYMISPEKITIAFLMNDLHNEYSLGICRGALYAAKELGVSMIFFGVGSLESPILHTVMRNKLFPIIDTDNFQGIICISSSISNYIGADKFLEYAERYKGIPVAHIGIEAPGTHGFNIDNASGMYDVVSHLIEEHGRKRIAFINGTRGVQEADDRFAAYKKALTDHGIPFDGNYVYDGNFIREWGILAVEEFIDKRKIKFDALVGANDHMALYAMKELMKRGYRIPEDISIGGFDDLASAKSHKPSLTTVRQPANKLGYIAVREFISKLTEGSSDICNVRLPTEMIIRESCGCTEMISDDTTGESAPWMSPEPTLSERDELDSILHIMTRNIIGTFEEPEICSVLNDSLKIFDIEEFSLSKYVDPLNSITFYSTRGASNRQFPSKWLVENKIRSFKRPFHKFVLPLFYRNEDIGFFISDTGSKDLSVLEVIRDHLSGALKGARLLGDAKQYAEGLEKMVEERTRELANRSNELENALRSVKLASEKLERLSVMDELTGLYNRRGFITVAKKQVELVKRQESNVLLVYIDLDGLKHINDNFGHAIGDIAIKTMADILVRAFRQTDIVSRLGGDEFTVLAIDCTIEDYTKIINRAERMVKEYNKTGKQSFRLSFSSGAAPSKKDRYLTLDELMDEADAELYKAKKLKKEKA